MKGWTGPLICRTLSLERGSLGCLLIVGEVINTPWLGPCVKGITYRDCLCLSVCLCVYIYIYIYTDIWIFVKWCHDYSFEVLCCFSQPYIYMRLHICTYAEVHRNAYAHIYVHVFIPLYIGYIRGGLGFKDGPGNFLWSFFSHSLKKIQILFLVIRYKFQIFLGKPHDISKSHIHVNHKNHPFLTSTRAKS